MKEIYAAAESFIDSVVLPELPVPESHAWVAPTPFDQRADQASVVGAGIFSFPEGTPISIRNAVNNWVLLANLAAMKAVPDRDTNMEEWFSVYHDTLVKTGWSVVEDATTENVENIYGSTVHEKILEVVTAVLAPVPAALAIITATLNALQTMNKDSHFITLFERKSKSMRSAGFAIANCEAVKGAANLRGLAFEIKARQTMTQVLFFKFDSREASLVRRTVNYHLSEQMIVRLADKVSNKVIPYHEDNIDTIDL